MVSNTSDAHVSEGTKQEIAVVNVKRIEDVGFDRARKGDRSRVGAVGARDDGGRIREDASRCHP